MKRIAILLVLLAPLLLAQDIIYTDSATIVWDAVTQLGNGDPIPAGWTIEYEVLLSDPEEVIGVVSQPTMEDIPVTWHHTRWIGVRAVTTESNGTVHRSGINWSNINGAFTPNPFGLCSRQGPAVPLNLRLQ